MPGVLYAGFVGYLTVRCAAPGCGNYARALHASPDRVRAWGEFLVLLHGHGWVVTRGSFRGPHYCPRRHMEVARAPR